MPRRSVIRLTDAHVKSLKPRDGRYEIFDATLAGFGVRISPSGTKTWIVLSRNLRRKTRASIGRYPQMGLAAARQRAMSVLNEMSEGEYKRASDFELFENALEEWYLRDQSQNKSYSQVKDTIELHVRPYLKNFRLRDIEKRDLLKIVDRVGAKAPTQANRVLSFTKRFFNWCVSRDYLEVSPANGIAKFKTEVSRERVLNDDEMEAVYNATWTMDYPFAPLFRILIFTGQRLNEVAGLRWSEVDFTEKRWVIPSNRAKNKSGHVVHLSAPVISELRFLRQVSQHDLIFTTTGTTAVSGFSKAKRKLDVLSGVTDWRLHDLRRTFATVATEKLGFEPVVVDRALNHVSGSVKGVAAVYQRGQYLEGRRTVLDAWANHIAFRSNPASLSATRK